jgi:hypothetical protein
MTCKWSRLGTCRTQHASSNLDGEESCMFVNLLHVMVRDSGIDMAWLLLLNA